MYYYSMRGMRTRRRRDVHKKRIETLLAKKILYARRLPVEFRSDHRHPWDMEKSMQLLPLLLSHLHLHYF
jgi:hypothetical protein